MSKDNLKQSFKIIYDICMAKKPYQTFIGYPFSQPTSEDFTAFEGFNKRSHFSYLKGFKSCLHQKITIYENVVFDVHFYLFIYFYFTEKPGSSLKIFIFLYFKLFHYLWKLIMSWQVIAAKVEVIWRTTS